MSASALNLQKSVQFNTTVRFGDKIVQVFSHEAEPLQAVLAKALKDKSLKNCRRVCAKMVPVSFTAEPNVLVLALPAPAQEPTTVSHGFPPEHLEPIHGLMGIEDEL